MLFVCLFVCLFLCDVACVLYVDQDRNTVSDYRGHCCLFVCLFVVFMLFVVVSILLEELVYFNSNVCVTNNSPIY